MAASLDNLNIQISASTAKAVTSVNNLVTALEKLKTALGQIDTKGLEECSKAAENLGGATVRMKDSVKTFKKLTKAVAEVSSQTEPLTKSADKAKDFADNVSAAAESTKNATKDVGGNATIGFSKFGQILKSLPAGVRGFTGTLKTVGSAFGNIAKKTLSSTFNLKKLSNGMGMAKNSAAKFVKELTRVGKMLKLMITRMVLRQIISGIGDGFKNLAQYSAKFNASISMLWNSFRQLGNSIAAAASPLLNAFAPALNAIIQLVIKAVNAINQLISAMLGLGVWTRAKTLTDDYAKSLDKASGSAKELKKTVLGFDELNQLQDNKNSGGGGTDPSNMFEEAGVSDKWKEWAEKLKRMWEKADFTELGATLGKKLLEALNKIPWAKIKRYARKVGKSLATLINGFIETDGLGNAIGKTLAEAINTGFEFANSFVHNFHWDSIGKFIANTFNGFFENIDWKLIKDTVVTGFKGLATSITNFVKTFNWDNVSETIINALDVISSGIKSFFENVDWGDLGRKIGDQLAKVIRDADWVQVGQAIGSVIQAAISFVKNLLSQLSWADIKAAIQDLLEGFFDKVNKDDIGAIIKRVLELALLVGVGSILADAAKIAFAAKIKAWVEGAVAEKTVEAAGTAAGSTVAGYIGSGVAAGLAGVALGSIISNWIANAYADKTVKEFRENGQETAAQTYEQFNNEYKGAIGRMREIYDFFTGELKKKTATIRDENGEIIRSVTYYGDTVISIEHDTQKALSDSSAKTREMMARTGTVIKQETLGMRTSVISNNNEIKDSTKGLTTTLQGETVKMKTSYANAQVAMSGEFKTLERNTKSTTDTIKQSFDKSNWTFSGVADGLRKTFEDAKNAIKGVWNDIADKLNGSHSIGGGSFHINLPRLYATGGFPEDGLFMANHNELVGRFSNGRTAVANNEQITAGIAQAVYSAMMASNSGGAQYINNTIEVDGVAIARAVTKGQRSLDRRYSPTMA